MTKWSDPTSNPLNDIKEILRREMSGKSRKRTIKRSNLLNPKLRQKMKKEIADTAVVCADATREARIAFLQAQFSAKEIRNSVIADANEEFQMQRLAIIQKYENMVDEDIETALTETVVAT